MSKGRVNPAGVVVDYGCARQIRLAPMPRVRPYISPGALALEER